MRALLMSVILVAGSGCVTQTDYLIERMMYGKEFAQFERKRNQEHDARYVWCKMNVPDSEYSACMCPECGYDSSKHTVALSTQDVMAIMRQTDQMANETAWRNAILNQSNHTTVTVKHQ